MKGLCIIYNLHTFADELDYYNYEYEIVNNSHVIPFFCIADCGSAEEMEFAGVY